MISNLKTTLRNFRLTRPIYMFLYNLWFKYTCHRQRKRLQKEGFAIISQLIKDIEQYPAPIFAAYGTLLGLVRESGFVKHDLDIDFGVINADLEDLLIFLKERGYLITEGFTYKNQLVEFSIEIKGIKVDFFTFTKNENYEFGAYVFHTYSNLGNLLSKNELEVAFIKCDEITKVEKYSVDGLEIPIPKNPEKHLSEIYTANWRTPNPNWDPTKGPAWNNLDGEKGIYIDFRP